MTKEEMEMAYNRLSMIHSETLLQLHETERAMKVMSKCWWSMLKFRIKLKLGLIDLYGDR